MTRCEILHIHSDIRDSLIYVVPQRASISFVKNNQLGATNIQNLFCHKTLHVSGTFCAHHQELSTVHPVIGTFHAGYVTAS